MKRFTVGMLFAALFGLPMLTGCVVHDRERVVRERPVVEERREVREVPVERDHHEVRVDVHP